jgi:NAD+ kinase
LPGRCGLIALMKFPFKVIALIGKQNAAEIAAPLMSLAAFLSSRGLTVVVDSVSAAHLNNSPYQAMNLAEIGEAVDLAMYWAAMAPC